VNLSRVEQWTKIRGRIAWLASEVAAAPAVAADI
jgi:hypothetical protein